MNVTFKSFKRAAFASQETNCFEAIVCIDGTPAFHASNEGSGGCDRYLPLNGQTPQKFREQLARFEAFAVTHPCAADFVAHPRQCVEVLIATLVEREIARRDLTRRLKKATLFFVQGPKAQLLGLRSAFSEAVKAHVLKRYPGASILNEMPESDALDAFIGLANAR